MPKESRRYEVALVSILCLTFGVTSFEQVTINYIMPFIQPDLRLDNMQIGLIAAGFTIAYAISSYVSGVLVDSIGRLKSILIINMAAFSVCSVLSSFSKSFSALLGARLLMGIFDGAVLPVVQSLVSLGSPAARRGMNMGIVQTLGSTFLALFVAPLVLVKLATFYGWRAGFLVTVLPGLLAVALIAAIIRAPERVVIRADQGSGKPGSGLLEILRNRNIWVCMVIFASIAAYSTIGWAFMPLFYSNKLHLSYSDMSILMSIVGVSWGVAGMAMPILSDRVGRKPVFIVGSLLGVAGSVAIAFYSGSIFIGGTLVFIAWVFAGLTPLAVATIPSETVPPRLIGTAMGLVLAVGMLSGGLAGPPIAGWGADRWGLRVPLLLQAGCAAAAAFMSLFLYDARKNPNKESVSGPAVVVS
jgi:MFS family permease